MLKKLAKSGFLIHAFILAGLTLVFILTPQVRFSSIQPPNPAAPLGAWLYQFISVFPHFVKPLAIALLVIISLIFNAILIRHDVSPRQSLFPATLTLLFMLFTPDPVNLILTEACLLLLLISMHNVMNLYGEQNTNYMILNATVAISIASMLIPAVLLFALFIWFGIFTFRINTWREWVISLIGLIIPYLYLIFLFFWNDNLEYAHDIYINYFRTITFSFNKPDMLEILTLSMMLLCTLIGLTRFLNDAGEKIISIRKKMWVTAQFAFAGLAVLVFSGDKFPVLLPVLFLPVAATIAYTIVNSRRSWFFDLLILLTALTAILNRINI